MKYVFVVAMSVVLLACQGNTQGKVDLKTQTDSMSYAIGMDIGKNVGGNLRARSVAVNSAALSAGLRATLDSAGMQLSDSQARIVMTGFQQRMMAKQQEEAAKQQEIAVKAGKVHRKEGEAFLAANKNKQGVKTTASGLQYKVVKMGKGPKPKADQTVSVNYRGTTIDGNEFDNSFKRGQPAEFAVNQVIQGWIEGIQLMPVGSKFEFYIPSNLAYGDQNKGPQIPPGSTLIFEVELLGIK